MEAYFMLIVDKKELEQYQSKHRVWQGIPGIEVTKGGRTFVVFYSGNVRETYGNYTMIVKSDDGINFSEPIAVSKKEGQFRCFDPVLWIDPLGRLWYIWNVMPGEEVFASVCENPDAEELEWSEEFYIGRGIMMNKPIVLSSDEWLFPIAIWNFELSYNLRRSALKKDDIAASYVYKTSDNGKTFVKLGGANLPNRSYDEHMIYETDNGVLRMLVRLQRGVGESFSYDRGKNWTKGNISNIKGPSSRFFVKKLPSGRVLLIYHNKSSERTNLTAFLSEDDGKTFPYSLLLDEREFVSYPDATIDKDGFIHIVYDRERGCFKNSVSEAYSCAREIIISEICEEDIINGTIINKQSYLKRIVSKLDTLAEGDPDPYEDEGMTSIEFARNLIENNVENPIDKVFEKYSLNCVNTENIDPEKIDIMITQFQESGSKDEKLLAKIIDMIKSVPKRKNDYPIVEMVVKYIEVNLSEDIPISRIAEEFNISTFYLFHIFKKVTGITIIEYRNELRLTKSKLLLIDTNMSITDISQKVGFDSASYFSEIFSRSEKISPKKYRELHQRERD